MAVLLIPWIEIVAGGHRRGQAIGARAVRPAPPPREALATAITLETAGAAIDLRLRPGDERWQAVDADTIRDHRLRLGLRLKLRLRTMLALAGMFARLMRIARLVGLALALVVARIVVARIVIAGIVVARHERLLLHRRRALAERLERQAHSGSARDDRYTRSLVEHRKKSTQRDLEWVDELITAERAAEADEFPPAAGDVLKEEAPA